MQNIRRSTKKHRKLLLAVVIMLMLGLVGSFATWNSNQGTAPQGENGEYTLEQQIEAYQNYIDELLAEHGAEADFSGSQSLAAAYLDLSYLYWYQQNELSSTMPETAEGEEPSPEAEAHAAALEAAENASTAAAQSAESYFQRALDNVPDGTNNAALAELKAGQAATREILYDYDGALAYMAEAYQLNPDNAQYLVAQASLHEKMGTYESALEIMEQLYEAYPENFQYRVQQASFLEMMGEYEDALTIMEEAYAAYPENIQYLAAQASLYSQIGDNDKAKEIYLQARELAPEDLNIANSYAFFLFSAESPQAGVDELKSFRAALPDGHELIEQADSAVANLEGWAGVFAGLGSSEGSEEDGTAEDEAE